MTGASASYTLAEHIHGSFFGQIDNLDPEEIENSGVEATEDSYPNHIPQLYARGEVEGERVYQTLSRGRNGDFYLTTTLLHFSRTENTRITPRADLAKAEVLASSLFMQALVTITKNRTKSEPNSPED